MGEDNLDATMNERAEEVKVLTRKRGQIKAKLTRLVKFLDTEEKKSDTNIEEIESRLENTKSTLYEFEEIQNEINCDKEDDYLCPVIEEFEINYYRAITRAKKLIEAAKNPATVSVLPPDGRVLQIPPLDPSIEAYTNEQPERSAINRNDSSEIENEISHEQDSIDNRVENLNPNENRNSNLNSISAINNVQGFNRMNPFTNNSDTRQSPLPSARNDTHTNAPPNFNVGNPIPINIRLPELELKTFDGTIEKFPEFYDNFKTAVHDANISDIHKLIYLRASLIGDAAAVIESLETRAENYSTAWDLVRERYDNRRVIIQKHVNALMNLPTIHKESAPDLIKMLDSIRSHLRALKTLGESVDSWDTLLIHAIIVKVDRNTHREWEKSVTGKLMPKLQTFISFLEKRSQILQATSFLSTSNYNNSSNSKSDNSMKNSSSGKHQTFAVTQKVHICIRCNGPHKVSSCEQFLKMTVFERTEVVKANKLCFNCLNPGHRNNECRWSGCKKCNKKHNTLLHYDSKVSNSHDQSGNVEQNSQQTSSHQEPNNSTENRSLTNSCVSASTQPNVVLGTAIVNFINANGENVAARVLLDSASQSNFISEKLAKHLNLNRQQISQPVGGICGLEATINNLLIATIKSQNSNYTTKLQFLIVPQVCSKLPNESINVKEFNIPNGIRLADPEFYEPHEIDALIGGEIFWETLCAGQIKIADQRAMFTKTKFGWIFAGPLKTDTNKSNSRKCFLSLDVIHKEVSKLWEIEEIQNSKFVSEEEYQVQKFYDETTRRDKVTGRIITRLPFNNRINNLGESYENAEKRFLSLEKRLERNPEQHKQYHKFMQEYIDLKHMEKSTDRSKNNGYFLPQQIVMKPSSQTTKYRVVFDASAKTKSGLSLNDCLKAGPNIQQNIFQIITRFRTHQIGITTDIEKMVRQVLVDDRDTPYQKILYRKGKDEAIEVYEAKTVTYGTKPASFLATRSVVKIAETFKNKYPKVHEILCRDMYMDDCVTGVDTLDEAVLLINQLIEVMKEGGFPLQKWASNSFELIKSLPTQNSNVNLLLDDECQGALGVQWDTRLDLIKYHAKKYEGPLLTKRIMLSNIAKLFDPIGLLGPVIVAAKLMMQNLWQSKLRWDDQVTPEINSSWEIYNNQLPILNDIKFDRKVLISNPKRTEIHGFSDASEKAYGACIFIRSINHENEIMINLLCSKNRVAPLKSISLPKLELCGALLLTRLLKSVTESINREIHETYLWTDSTITLQWINTQPHHLKTFVANRVSEIRSNSDIKSWRHVPSKENPADCLSRGQLPSELIKNELWKNGPIWLKSGESHWPNMELSNTPLLEVKRTVMLSRIPINNPFFNLLKKYSSFAKLNRVIAYCVRFINNLKTKSKNTDPLTTDELKEARVMVIKMVQTECFSDDIRNLKTDKSITNTSKLKALNPFLDENEIVRVGGRLQKSSLSYSEKHPIVLPKNHHITDLIIEKIHRDNLHSGTQTTLHIMRSNYWPISGKNSIKKVIRNCIKCFRAKPNNYEYLMGNLPTDRVNVTRPFSNTGIDYCGPFYIKEKKFRNRGKVKVYASIFVCFATKACHIELVTDLTTSAFLAALRRFFARRGKSLNLYSDNGTNFVGAKNEIKSLIEFVKSNSFNQDMNQSLSNEGINWHFSPPGSPHFGGLWEAAVKSFKYHLARTIGDKLFTYEELYTFTTEIEGILNSRPITALSSDPNDLHALSPAHFLIGTSLATLPECDVTHLKINQLSVWQHIQFMKQHFWKRWSKEYLNELNTRTKWQQQRAANIQPGTMVILKEKNQEPLHWPLGIISKVHPGDDGIVRAVTIKTKSGEYVRSAKSVAILPIS